MPRLKQVVNVAVAVIHYQENYLLGYRQAEQHQGDRYEFIGGKIDDDETPIQALIREVDEELGLTIKYHENGVSDDTLEDKIKEDSNVISQLGRLHHDYGDKKVCLHIFRVGLSQVQFANWRYKKVGTEGQRLTWLDKQALLSGRYALPDANRTILAWLALEDSITITYEVNDFSNDNHNNHHHNNHHHNNDSEYQKQQSHSNQTAQKPLTYDLAKIQEGWLNYHKENLPREATVYVRHKLDLITHKIAIENLIEQLISSRPDLKIILSNHDIDKVNSKCTHSIVAQHLTQNDLIALTEAISVYGGENTENADELRGLLQTVLNPNCPITASCHDETSVNAANTLAQICIQLHYPPVIGIFLSPVQTTKTHKNSTALGWDRFKELTELSTIPSIALGGLQPQDLIKVRYYHGDKIAGIRKFIGKPKVCGIFNY